MINQKKNELVFTIKFKKSGAVSHLSFCLHEQSNTSPKPTSFYLIKRVAAFICKYGQEK